MTDTTVLTSPTFDRPLIRRGIARRLNDVGVLTWRNLTHVRREPFRLSDATIQPIVFTLLFVYVFGSAVTLPAGGSYTQFAIAGLIALNVTTSAIGTAIGLCDDLGSGAIDRFRTLPMWRSAVLVARSLADLLAGTICIAFVALTGLIVGWRPEGDLPQTVGGFGIFLLFSYCLSWPCACLGAASDSAESAQGIGLIILLTLAVVSNAIVPTQHMPAPLRTFANWNPVSTVTAVARGLFKNPNPSASLHVWPMQHPALASLLWCLALLVFFAPLATHLYRRRTTD